MSVRLVFVWPNGPDGLKGELSRGAGAGELRPGVLRPQEHPLALPQRKGRDDLSGDQTGHSVLDVVPTSPGAPSLPQLVGRADVTPKPRLPDPRVLLAKGEDLA